MLLVVYGHALEVLFIDRPDNLFVDWAFTQWQFIYSFHMPLFIFLSGAAQQDLPKKPIISAIASSLSLFYIGFIVHLFGIIALYFFRVQPLSDWQLAKWSVGPLFKGFHFTIPVVWFLITLAIVQFIFYLAIRFRGSLAWTCAILLVLVFSLVLSLQTNFQNYFQVKIWLPAFLFFAAGWQLRRAGLAPPVALALPCAAGVICLYGFNHGCPFTVHKTCPLAHLDGRFGVQMIQGAVGNFGLFYVTALAGTVGVMSMAKVCKSKALTWVGRNSFGILISNGIVLTFINPMLRLQPLADGLWSGVALLSVAVLANVFFYLVLCRPLDYILSAGRSSTYAAASSLASLCRRRNRWPIGKQEP